MQNTGTHSRPRSTHGDDEPLQDREKERETWTLTTTSIRVGHHRRGGHRSQLLLETSLQLSNQQRVTVLSQNSSHGPLSNEMEDKDEHHMGGHVNLVTLSLRERESVYTVYCICVCACIIMRV